jgi:hypothetical protein
MGLVAILVVVLLRYADPWLSILPLGALVFLYLIFRDPRREVPSVALGIVSPVDGEVVEVDTTDRCVVQGEAYRVRIHIHVFGTYTARSPIEGRIMDLHSKVEGIGPECPANAQWVETDEGDSVVLQFHEYRFGSSWANASARATVVHLSALRDTPNCTCPSTGRCWSSRARP